MVHVHIHINTADIPLDIKPKAVSLETVVPTQGAQQVAAAAVLENQQLIRIDWGSEGVLAGSSAGAETNTKHESHLSTFETGNNWITAPLYLSSNACY
jgi:hypothetical protein